MPRRRAPWWPLVGGAGVLALACALGAAVTGSLAAVVAGRLAHDPGGGLVATLALLAVAGVTLATITGVAVSHGVGHAEGRLRARLVDATLRQPLPALEEQGVGELLDRVDDDPAQLAALVRGPGSWTVEGILRAAVAWIVAGITWWPAWPLFPVLAVVALLVVRRGAPRVAALKVAEEAAWSEHGSQLEESVAARDDLRTSLGQPFALRQYALRSRDVLGRVRATTGAATAVTAQVGVLLAALVAVVTVGGVALVARGGLGIASLVTLWLLVAGFVGQLAQVAGHLPELQSGLGALQRVRALLAAPSEPRGGAPVAPGRLDVTLDGLTVTYPGGFTLGPLTLAIPAGTTCAVVGRTGSGKSTLTKVLSRAVEPPAGTVRLGGQDVLDTDLETLRRRVGVVAQRTEILAGTIAENVALFADVPRSRVRAALDDLGLGAWVASFPAGLDTVLGPDGVTLSAGEEQLVAFARLLVRDVSVVVLDEATARMDPQTAQRVTEASRRLLAGRTGVVVAHRLATARHTDAVAVLDRGRLVEHGTWSQLAAQDGQLRALLAAGGGDAVPTRGEDLPGRRPRDPARPAAPAQRPRLGRATLRLALAHARWGVAGDLVWCFGSAVGVGGVVTGLLWGRVAGSLQDGHAPWLLAVLLAAGVLVSPVALAVAARTHPRWLASVTLRLRLAVLRGQTGQHRLPRTPAGAVTARALDSARLTSYVDSWIGVVYGVVFAVLVAVLGGGLVSAAITGGVMALSALASTLGVRAVASAAREAGDARVRLGRALASTLEAVRTVKLAGATSAAHEHLAAVDRGRIRASLRENRIRVLYGSVPFALVQTGVVAAWALRTAGVWNLATTLMLVTTIGSFGWFGTVAGQTVTGAAVARRWLAQAAGLAGTRDLASNPRDVDLVRGAAAGPVPIEPGRLRTLRLEGLGAVHDDGTVGVSGVDLSVSAGEVVLVTGRVGSGKSSLLAALAGLVDLRGTIRWDGTVVTDPETFLRPGRVAYVAQVPRVVSGTVAENVRLGRDVPVDDAVRDARLDEDLAGTGTAARVGHRGTRLSGGQVQRVALARALATRSALLVADDVSSALDARTEAEVWAALRRRGVTVVGSTSRRAALAAADRVVVLDAGRVVAVGPWADLADRWDHLAA